MVQKFYIILLSMLTLSASVHAASAAGYAAPKKQGEREVDIKKEDFDKAVSLSERIRNRTSNDDDIRLSYGTEILKSYTRSKLDAMLRWAKDNHDKALEGHVWNLCLMLDEAANEQYYYDVESQELDEVQFLRQIKQTKPELLDILVNAKYAGDDTIITRLLKSWDDQKDTKPLVEENTKTLLAMLELLPEVDWSLETPGWPRPKSTFLFLCEAIKKGLVDPSVLKLIKFDLDKHGGKYYSMLNNFVKDFTDARLSSQAHKEKCMQILLELVNNRKNGHYLESWFTQNPTALEAVLHAAVNDLPENSGFMATMLPYIHIKSFAEYVKKAGRLTHDLDLAQNEYAGLVRAHVPQGGDFNPLINDGYLAFKNGDKKPLQTLLLDTPYKPEVQSTLCEMFTVDTLYLLMECLLRDDKDKEKAYQYIAPCEQHGKASFYGTHALPDQLPKLDQAADELLLQHKKRFFSKMDTNYALQLLQKTLQIVQANDLNSNYNDHYFRYKLFRELNNLLADTHMSDEVAKAIPSLNLDKNAIGYLFEFAVNKGLSNITRLLLPYAPSALVLKYIDVLKKASSSGHKFMQDILDAYDVQQPVATKLNI